MTWLTTSVVPVANSSAAMSAATLSLAMVISFKASFTRVRVATDTAEPWTAIAAMVAASPAGAAWTACADIAPARMAVVL